MTTRRSQASRQAILDAALDLVGEVGYSRLSIEGIAARAGTGKQTIYRWWSSKGAVLFDALLSLSSEPAPELPDTGDLAADLKTVLRATIDELNEPRLSEPMRALTVEILLDPEIAADFAERLDEPMKEIKRKRLRTALAAGRLNADVDIAIDILWAPVQRRWLFRDGPLTHDFADAVVDTALAGLAPR